MTAWLEPLLSNAIVATLLALLVAAIALFRPRPAVLHALWLIVLLKFVTPPLIRIELPSGGIQPAHPSTTGEFAETGLASWIPDYGSDRLFVDEATPSASFGGILLDGDDSVGSPLARDVGSVGIASVEAEGRSLGAANGGHEPGGFPQPRRAGNAGRSPSVLVDAVSQLARSLGSRLPEWLPAVFAAIWAAGSAAWFVLAGVRLVRFRRQLGRTRPAGDALQRIADEVAERLGLRARPIVRLTDANLPPMLTTFRRRGLVLLPSELLRGLSEPQQATIIAHELAHFRRGDHWVRWLEFVVVGLYWWHPVAWLTRRQLQQAEESCCDAWVLRVFPDQARGYAQALMATVDFLSEVRTPAPAGACGFGRVHSLKRRLEMILKRTWRPDLSSAARLTLLAVALVVLPWTPRAFSQSGRTPDNPKKPASTARNADPAELSTAAEPETAPALTPQQNAAPAANAAAKPVATKPGAEPPANPIGEAIVARVNNEPITYKELAEECIARQGAEILETMIFKQIWVQVCRENAIKITTKEIDDEIGHTAERLQMTRQDYLRVLENERGIPNERYINDIVRPGLELKKLAKQILRATEGDIQIEDEIFKAKMNEQMQQIFQNLKNEAKIEKYLTGAASSRPPTAPDSQSVGGDGQSPSNRITGGGVTDSGGTLRIDELASPPPAQPSSPSVSGRSRLGTLHMRTADPYAANVDIKAKLVDLEFEIKSLQLHLERARAQREFLEKRLKEWPDDSTSTSPSGQPARTAPPKGTR